MDVIDKINALLKEKGINGAELSRMIGVSSAVYSQWNRKVTKPSNKNIAKVASALSVPVSCLTSEAQKENSPQSREPPKYNQLTPENRAMIDDLIEKLLKSQSGG